MVAVSTPSTKMGMLPCGDDVLLREFTAEARIGVALESCEQRTVAELVDRQDLPPDDVGVELPGGTELRPVRQFVSDVDVDAEVHAPFEDDADGDLSQPGGVVANEPGKSRSGSFWISSRV